MHCKLDYKILEDLYKFTYFLKNNADKDVTDFNTEISLLVNSASNSSGSTISLTIIRKIFNMHNVYIHIKYMYIYMESILNQHNFGA